ncbi:MAG: A/G-specific adenine glycosylase [Burkholderiaceae bacterium]|nr:A/G-specific adenine glycosylase [Burkholderiaceae bacterium]
MPFQGGADGGFARRVIAWQQCHGRRGLPWQCADPYRVWLSEIMLQQTQVATVLDYYPRFLARFPDVRALAAAPQDEVLALWSGLGYYARARNLHRCAQTVVAEHGGCFPDNAATLQTLPGIGQSTAAAIAAFCFGERAAILDGNVRRVLARVFGIADDVSQPAPQRQLWSLAQSLLPAESGVTSMAPYTQGLMDLGALVCTRRAPTCAVCPLAAQCVAARQGNPEAYPRSRPPLQRKTVALALLLARDGAGRVWLAPQTSADSVLRGIWRGLYILPVFGDEAALLAALPTAARERVCWRAPIGHALTHRDLVLHVAQLDWPDTGSRTALAFPAGGRWFAPQEWRTLGLPAPVARLLGLTSVKSASGQSPGAG